MTPLLRSLAFWTDIVIAAILVVALFEMRDFGAGARFIPALFAWITLGLVALDILRQVLTQSARARRQNGNPVAKLRQRPPAAAPLRDSLRVIAYVAFFWVMVLLFGFNGIPALLIWAYLTVEARVNWHVGLFAAIFGNFGILWGMSLLGVRVWKGAGPEIWPDVIGGATWPLF